MLTFDLATNQIHTRGESHTARHHKAVLFLHMLTSAATQDLPLHKADFLREWALLQPGSQPDRTALTRVIAAAEELLRIVGVEHGRLQCQPRRRSTGPWLLVTPPDSPWLKAATRLRHASLEHTASLARLGHNAEEARGFADQLSMADMEAMQGEYAAARHRLERLIKHAGLTGDAMCLAGMRWLMCNRKQPGTGKADAVMTRLRTAVHADVSPAMRKHVEASLGFYKLRQSFNHLPHATSLSPSMVKVYDDIAAPVCARHQMELSNMQALQWRRLMMHAPTRTQELAARDRAEALSQAAYFWACVAQDVWWQQSTAVNYGHLLGILWKRKLLNSPRPALQWFIHANTLDDRFDLPRDCAWDFILFGLFYQELQARGLSDDWRVLDLAWPESADPNTDLFYDRGVDLAQRYGDARQQILALNLKVWRHQQDRNDRQIRQARAQRDALIQAHPRLHADMLQDDFVAH